MQSPLRVTRHAVEIVCVGNPIQAVLTGLLGISVKFNVYYIRGAPWGGGTHVNVAYRSRETIDLGRVCVCGYSCVHPNRRLCTLLPPLLPSCPIPRSRPELYPTQIRSTGHALSNALARCGAIGASYWVATPFSNEVIAVGLCVVGIIGGLTAQARKRLVVCCLHTSGLRTPFSHNKPCCHEVHVQDNSTDLELLSHQAMLSCTYAAHPVEVRIALHPLS